MKKIRIYTLSTVCLLLPVILVYFQTVQNSEISNTGSKEIKKDKKKRGAQRQKEYLEKLYAPFSLEQIANMRNEQLIKRGSFKNLLSDEGTDNSTTWNSIGPKGIYPNLAGQYILSGRVISLALDQVDNDIIYLGSASGGLWKSTNQGASWFQLLDTLTNPTIAAIAIEPNNHNNIWIGTSSVFNGYNGFSARVLRSTDGGLSWIQFPAGGGSRLPANLKGIHKIAIDNFRNQYVYIASDSGLYRTSNSGANWINKATATFSDVIVSSGLADTNSVVIAAAINGGLTRSTNNGTSFSAYNALGFPWQQIGRISLTHHNLFPVMNNVHCIIEDLFSGSQILLIAKSQDTGRSWLFTNFPAGGPQGGYNNCIMMNPVNPDTLLVGWQNRESFRSTDGGNSWGNSSTIHDDYHCFAASLTNPDLVFLGCDGGVFKSTNFGGNWQNCGNEYLTISQIYYITQHPVNPYGEWAGLQDNGVISGHNGGFGWFSETCCDGGDITFKADTPYVNLAGLTDASGNWAAYSWERKTGINSWEDFTQGISQTGAMRIPPGDFIYMNSRFYTFHNDTVYKTSTSGNLPWTPLGGSPVNDNTPVNKIYPVPEGYVYASINDTAKPLRIYAPGTNSWYSPSGNTLNGRTITGFSMGGFYNGSNRIMYLTRSGITGSRVFKSIDNGLSWINISSNLPSAINLSCIYAVNDKLIFTGSDFGLFATTTGGASWLDYSANLPSTPWITDIDYRYFSFPELLIGTYGRGMWSRDVSDLVVSEYKIFTGKINKNWSDDLNWVPSKPLSGEKAMIASDCILNEPLPNLNSLQVEPDDTLDMASFQMPDIANITNNGTIITRNNSSLPIPANKLWGGEVIFSLAQFQYIPAGIYNRLNLTGGNKFAEGDLMVTSRLNIDADTVKMGIYRLIGPLSETNEYWSESVLETQNLSAGPLPNYVQWNFKVLFSASSNQYIPPGSYYRLFVKNGFIKNLSGNIRITQELGLLGAVIALNEYNITMESLANFSQSGILFSSSNMLRTNSTGRLERVVPDHSYFYPQLFPVGYISYNPAILKFNSLLNTDTFAVRVQNTISPGVPNPNKVVNSMWTITEDNPGGSNVEVNLGYSSSQFAGEFSNTVPEVYTGRHNGSMWALTDVSVIDSSGNYNFLVAHNAQYMSRADNFTEFSPFIVLNEGALPVMLSAFSAAVNKNNVNLSWTTSMEINNAGFNIERLKMDETGWIKAGDVPGHGNTKDHVSYSFEDKKLNTGNYRYRLKQFDYNGNFEYFYLSDTVDVGRPKNYELSQNYPNPFNPLTKIDYDIPFDGKLTIKIYDILGREVFVLVNNEFKPAGYYTAEFNGSNLASGVYFYRLVSEKYSQVKKMVIIK